MRLHPLDVWCATNWAGVQKRLFAWLRVRRSGAMPWLRIMVEVSKTSSWIFSAPVVWSASEQRYGSSFGSCSERGD